MQAVAPADTTSVGVEVGTPVGTRRVIVAPVAPGSVYDNPTLALDKRVAPYGVGLYRVHITSGSCDQTIWV